MPSSPAALRRQGILIQVSECISRSGPSRHFPLAPSPVMWEKTPRSHWAGSLPALRRLPHNRWKTPPGRCQVPAPWRPWGPEKAEVRDLQVFSSFSFLFLFLKFMPIKSHLREYLGDGVTSAVTFAGLIHSFTRQIFPESLQCAWYCSRLWGFRYEYGEIFSPIALVGK